ncbi:443_t:CDS:10, partial [Entrophospora sp. SA101]
MPRKLRESMPKNDCEHCGNASHVSTNCPLILISDDEDHEENQQEKQQVEILDSFNSNNGINIIDDNDFKTPTSKRIINYIPAQLHYNNFDDMSSVVDNLDSEVAESSNAATAVNNNIDKGKAVEFIDLVTPGSSDNGNHEIDEVVDLVSPTVATNRGKKRENEGEEEKESSFTKKIKRAFEISRAAIPTTFVSASSLLSQVPQTFQTEVIPFAIDLNQLRRQMEQFHSQFIGDNVDQLEDDDNSIQILYGNIKSKVVGIRYYNGTVNRNEAVSIIREPDNIADSNALRVDNILGNQVGHIPRDIARILAPMIDLNEIRIEGTISGRSGTHHIPLLINVFGSPENEDEIKRKLRSKVSLDPPTLTATGSRGKGSRSKDRLKGNDAWQELISKGTQIDSTDKQILMKRLGIEETDLAKLAEATQPTSLITNLLKYQRQGLGWMLAHEHPDEPTIEKATQFWMIKNERGTSQYYNIATNFSTTTKPLFARGGILADVLSIYVFHGNNRNDNPYFLASHDVVITTYNMLSVSGNNHKKGLFAVKWRRIVLDEGHIIRSKKTKQSEAAFALEGERRWILTGTPIMNKLNDMDPVGVEQLKVLMRTICLRRTKDMKFDGRPILELPPITSYLHKIQFTPEEKKKYEFMENDAQSQFKKWRSTGEVMSHYSIILEVLTRLRQICDHHKLCEHRLNSLIERNQKEIADALNNEDLQDLYRILQTTIDDNEDCCICLETLSTPIITPCRHVFDRDCIEKALVKSESCPLCRNNVSKNQLIDPPPVPIESSEQTNDDIDEYEDENDSSKSKSDYIPSSKIEALMDFLKVSSKNDPSTKSVVFSQWTSFLDLIEKALNLYGFKFVRLDGKMQRHKRDEVIRLFQTDGSIQIFLASLKCCSLGLNLTAANQCFIMDPWWNPSIDRVYRLGQTRPVSIFRFVIQDTIEERVMKLQERKRKLVSNAFGEKIREDASRVRE